MCFLKCKQIDFICLSIGSKQFYRLNCVKERLPVHTTSSLIVFIAFGMFHFLAAHAQEPVLFDWLPRFHQSEDEAKESHTAQKCDSSLHLFEPVRCLLHGMQFHLLQPPAAAICPLAGTAENPHGSRDFGRRQPHLRSAGCNLGSND